MSVKRFLAVGSVVLSLLFLIIAFGMLWRCKCQRMGIFRVLSEPISYNITMQELENLLGDPEKVIDKGNGCIELRYNLSTRYEKPAEVSFLFGSDTHKLYYVFAEIKLDTVQESSILFQQIREDLMSEYKGPFYVYRQGSLDSEIIGVESLFASNYVEIVNDGNTIILSGFF